MSSVVVTELLRTRVAPALRQMGFRGSGQHFRLADAGGHHAVLSVIRSLVSVPGEAMFTLELAFHEGGEAWAAARAAATWLPDPPTAARLVVETAWHQRIGQLLEPPHDHWWLVQEPDDAARVADEVVAAVRDAALPQLVARVRGEQPPAPPVGTDPAGPGAETERVRCPSPYCSATVLAARHGW